jgi:hypothetical protein
MMTLEERLIAMEQRLNALEQENRELKAAAAPRPTRSGPRPVPPMDKPVTKDPEKIRELIERELTPHQRMKIKELAIDTMRYGYDQAMVMHGRSLPKRGRRAAH